MIQPGRNFNSSEYRFGFNGQEKDDEISGVGNSYTAEFWQYDARLGRRWNIDPVDKAWMSSYHAFSNKPIFNVDPNGANADWYQGEKKDEESGSVVHKEGDAKTIDVNGETFTNIGKTYSAPMADGGGYVNYFQDMPIAITNSKADVGQLLAKNDNIFSNALKMAPTREMQSEIFMTSFNINRSEASSKALIGTFAVPAAVLGGELLLSGGIISTSFWGGKAAISAGSQAIMNKGNVDVFDVGMDALMTPGASALFGGAVDINVGKDININWLGNGKTLSQFGVDVSTSYLSGKMSSKAYNSISPYLQNGTENAIFNTVISVPSSVLGTGANKVIKKKISE